MKNRVVVDGEPETQPKRGDNIKYLNKYGG